MVMRAQQSGQDPQEFANHMFEHNHVPELVAEIRRGKALAQIVEGATVTDASGHVIDLKNLRPDGTLGDPAEATEATQATEATEAADEESAPSSDAETDEA
jgi:trigger factor